MQISTGDIVYAQGAIRVGDQYAGQQAGMSLELGHDESVTVIIGDMHSYNRCVMISYQEFIEMAAAIVAIKEKRENVEKGSDLRNTRRANTDHASCTRCGNAADECIC